MKILLIEDNPGDARLIRELLREAHDDSAVSVKEKLGLGIEFLRSQDVDVILLDMNLPDSVGLDTFGKLEKEFPHIPIVITTSINDEELAARSLQLGAQDYLVKGHIDGMLLRHALRYAVARKRAEEAVLRAKEEWETTFYSVPDLIAILDNQHRIVRVNKAMADRLGMAPEECAGLHCYEAVHGLSCPPDFCPHVLTCRDGMEHTIDVNEPRLGGDFLVSTTPIFDVNKRITGTVHVARDFTERKKMEEELRHRTEDLEASNKELEAFSYSVSHDLRAPLRSMEGFSSALLEDYSDKLDEQGKQYLKYIQESSDLMGRLIDDLLKLSRVTRSDINFEMVDLTELAYKVIDELKKAEPGQMVQVNIAPGVEAYGDRNLLRVVLENLLGNAWKFSSKNALPQIEMGTTEKNGKLVYFIRDNGVGFDMVFVNKLFKPFQRLHKVSEFPGTGIGLASVYRIIRRHGGEVWAESKEGEGAAFYFRLMEGKEK